MNTKKDFIRMAGIIRLMRQDAKDYPHMREGILFEAQQLEDISVRTYTYDNPRFDEKRFREACK